MLETGQQSARGSAAARRSENGERTQILSSTHLQTAHPLPQKRRCWSFTRPCRERPPCLCFVCISSPPLGPHSEWGVS
ncbi:hypothetical protein OJAV_G00219350 [Oryzias javanicus]|uniref:Uncharacterized protein n=1 Tax=Oryzias javanicus TaxID=123683 RepID=A0A3S2PN47_ORYJA|nr:hypothetical protein OJAV_G00219350 [Oryzias javanicus]